MKTLILIPARGGSKGLPGKNIKQLLGKPLILYTIDEALKIKNINYELCVSTDSMLIKKVVEKSGIMVPFLRPDSCSDDFATTESVIIHALEWYRKSNIDFSNIILLQPTSPLRRVVDIEMAFKKYNSSIDMVVSVCETKSNPYYNLFEENNNGYLFKSKEYNATRRQDCPKVFEVNGAIYVINVQSLYKYKSLFKFPHIKKYVMDQNNSIDIDTELDFKLAELNLLNKINSAIQE
jgi:CMP-N,N'-diacetyllegionaminic acid synthase